MRTISNTFGPISYGETSGEDRNSPDAIKRQKFEDMIKKANTVPLIRVFAHYKIRVDTIYSTIVCPFKSHKGGRENSASFVFYPETNSFYCFGCKVGGPFAHGCEFIAQMEGLSRVKAAYKILTLFKSSLNEDMEVAEAENLTEKLEVMSVFSDAVREFHQNHFDEKSYEYIERVCAVYDTLNAKRKLDNEALRRLGEELILEIKSYKSCLM
jgi:DNA primase